MKNLFFYDADCEIGAGPLTSNWPGTEGLLAEMDRLGVDKALVGYGNTAMLGALQSNILLEQMLQLDEDQRLTGIWCMLPSQCDELPEPDEFFRRMKAARIRALSFYPVDHRYVPCRLTLGKMMDAAAERKIPVMLKGLTEKWQELYRFAAEFPRNRFILCESHGKWGHDRQVRPLLENYPEFYYGMSTYWVPEGIRDLAERYGAERILFASGYPQYQMGSPMLQLKQSGLAEKDIALIAGKNLQKILDEVEL